MSGADQLASVPEAVAWRVRVNENGRVWYIYTERLPYTPDDHIKVLSEPEPLYATPQAVPAGDVEEIIDRLNEKHATWQKLCDRWIAKGKADGMDIEDDFTALRKTTEGEAADALARIAEERNAYIKACDDYERDLKRSEAEATSLRSIIGECAKALGNGAYIAPTCTVEFMGNLPEEIRLLVADLRRKLEERERIGKMMANAIYNVHQRGLLVNADDMDSLKECQEAWDRTLSGASE
jgi:hypothetical protein